MEKVHEFQLTKIKMDLNIRKMTNHPPSPDCTRNNCLYNFTIPQPAEG